MDSAGGRSAGGSYSNISAVAQPSGVSISQGASMINAPGFLNTFIIQPALDTDRDGLANELDADNDNDALDDTSEIAGIYFDPTTATDMNRADSDADGADDGEEALAGTDPWDPAVAFRITALKVTNTATIAWLARSNYTYRIARSTNLLAADGGFVPIETVTVDKAASGPWFVVTNAYTDTLNAKTNRAVYRIELK
jgi:hypothetical protein